MNKSELIDSLATRLAGDKKTASAAVDGLIDVVSRAVSKGEKVAITGFGVFEKRNRSARTARNPRTGQAIKVKKTSVPAFRPGQQFKDVVSGAKKLGKVATAPVTAAATGSVRTAKSTAAATPAKSTAAKTATSKSTAKATPAKKTTTKSTAAKDAPAAKSAARKTSAASAAKAPAKRAAKSTTTKSTAKKASAKKSS